ncbi:MAG: hypothetical protein ACYDC3_14540 [Candidatus Binataceae bacterium]
MPRGLEAHPSYFVLALIFSLLFVLVTWRWAGLVNPRVWSVWEQSDTTVSEPVATSAVAVPEQSAHAAAVERSKAEREKGSKAMLLRMFALGLGNTAQQ